ncbi:MAG TPA: O-antigen ligase family protein [Xanthomonadales bacterium]|nr:O-antigen ligase family protein [Xanthomonadales bacterium]
MSAFVAAALAILLVLLPVGRTAEIALLAVALAGVVAAWRARGDANAWRGAGLALLAFAAYWLPALLSAFDAVAPDKSWSTVAGTVRFLPFALGAVLALRDAPAWQARVARAAGAIVALWTVDALLQAATGWSLGGRLQVDRISGVFGDDNLKLGPALAVLSPFALVAARRFGRAALLAAWLALAAAVLLAGARAGWVMFAIVTLALAWREAGGARRFAAWCAAALAAIALLGVSAYHGSARFELRIERTLAATRGDADAIDFALAGRLPIWRTALAMAAAHPVNGVGVRGFRHAYPDHAAPGDPWVAPGSDTGALHAHQLVLELLAETGAIGLLAWLVAAFALVRAGLRARGEARTLAWPPAVALVAMTFPLNTHFAFYSAFWGLVLWWLLALWLAAVATREPR